MVEEVKPELVALRVVEGLAEGLGLNYLWEALRLPGCGVGVGAPVPGFKPGVQVGLGVDDVAELLIGTGVGVYGGVAGDYSRVAQGVGIVGGVGLSKLFEAFGGGGVSSMDPLAKQSSTPALLGKYLITG